MKSHFREGIDNLVKNSAVNLNIEMPPDDLVDDSTKEIIRLKFKVFFIYYISMNLNQVLT